MAACFASTDEPATALQAPAISTRTELFQRPPSAGLRKGAHPAPSSISGSSAHKESEDRVEKSADKESFKVSPDRVAAAAESLVTPAREEAPKASAGADPASSGKAEAAASTKAAALLESTCASAEAEKGAGGWRGLGRLIDLPCSLTRVNELYCPRCRSRNAAVLPLTMCTSSHSAQSSSLKSAASCGVGEARSGSSSKARSVPS
mmetsp:Transcript_39974/g.98872  ORF Transcript_39974/g.98872 Transcript_39974/m.98872 type:complete len:206 (-) Transcript_39974:1686-2303(-)